jgi:hypothetical protein
MQGFGEEDPPIHIEYDEHVEWDSITMTWSGETTEVIDGRVIVGWRDKPTMPVKDPDYFDDIWNSSNLSGWYDEFEYPQSRLAEEEVVDFMTAEDLTPISEWSWIGYLCVELPEETSIADAISQWPLEYPELIATVEPDILYKAHAWPSTDPNDQHFKPISTDPTQAHQWHLDNRYDLSAPFGVPDWPAYDANVQPLWQENEGKAFGTSSVVRVMAVLDTGVDHNHPDLTARSTERGCNTYESKASTKFHTRAALGGRPYIDYLNRSEADAEALGHGTFVTGCAMASINNDNDSYNGAKDIAGIAHSPLYFPIAAKHLAPKGFSNSALINGVTAVACARRILNPDKEYPVGHNCPQLNIEVVNCSFGDYAFSAGLHDAIYKLQPYIVFVCSAGNEGRSDKNAYPAAYTNSIAVASYVRSGSRSTFSNYATTTDIAAPGTAIWSTDMMGVNSSGDPLGYSNTNIAQGEGTSYAAPQVAAVATILSIDKNPAQIRDRLVNYTTSLPDGSLPWGSINAWAAVYE